MMRWRTYKPGTPVIFRMHKHSHRPGVRAQKIQPDPHGESYRYQVDKFWIVADVCDNGELLLQTRRGKVHRLDATDPNLRHATWWERFWYSHRFPQTAKLESIPG